MVKITVEEFEKEWNKSDGRSVRLYLTPKEILEWIKHGKFSKIKEYCQGLPYQVKMICLEPFYGVKGKSFGFVLRTMEECSLLIAAWHSIKGKRTCIEVEKISFQELKPDTSLIGNIGDGAVIGAVCPLVI